MSTSYHIFHGIKYDVDALVTILDTPVTQILGTKLSTARHIALKPNLSDLMVAETGVTTSATLVEAVIKLIRRKSNAKISIVESNHWSANADEEFDSLGFREISEKYKDCNLVNLSKQKLIPVNLPDKVFPSLDIPEIWLDVDLFISLPKLKTHSAELISCGLKNQFGLLPGKYKAKHHKNMSRVLYWLNTIYPADLCLVDGIYALEREGPTDGIPAERNIVIAAKDCLWADMVACGAFGINPLSVPHLKYFARLSNCTHLRDFDKRSPKLQKVLSPPPRTVFLSHRAHLFSQRYGLKPLETLFSTSASFFSFMSRDLSWKEKINRLISYAKGVR